jgi:hypothetical protein
VGLGESSSLLERSGGNGHWAQEAA